MAREEPAPASRLSLTLGRGGRLRFISLVPSAGIARRPGSGRAFLSPCLALRDQLVFTLWSDLTIVEIALLYKLGPEPPFHVAIPGQLGTLGGRRLVLPQPHDDVLPPRPVQAGVSPIERPAGDDARLAEPERGATDMQDQLVPFGGGWAGGEDEGESPGLGRRL